jgi:serine/threonine protein kinase
MNESADREVSIFGEALDLPSGERSAYLDRACEGNPTLRRRIEKMLAAQDSAGTLFEDLERETVSPKLRPIERPGTWIDRYLLHEQIGEGGCGVVYRAEQERPVQRDVALKIIKLGMDTQKVVARFEAERQALALMDHPHIARVLDAGTTETGRPYFVMDLVRGKKITDFCDEHRLSIRERLDLFIQVCRAIQHAHQKGVIHRDIKPSNVLVSMQDGTAVPKVIDFGIAKATQGRLTDQTVSTVAQQFIGTPAYMSPEQTKSGAIAIDTRSDIYSLGVLLYEVLTGETPFDGKRLAQADIIELFRVLREEEAPAPSTFLAKLSAEKLAAVAELRGVEPRHLLAAVKGDLDWIVLKALAKDPGQRYDTVNGLDSDLRRHLNDEPVQARPPGRLYLLGKLARRNKGVFISAGGVLLALVMGLIVSSWFYFREREARREQALLRQAAEAARANEARLLEQAKARESVSQAAILLAGGKLEEADALLTKTPLKSIEPSMEATNLFRALGDWNSIRQRWRQAADCYTLYLQASRMDRPPTNVSSLMRVLSIAPALVKGKNFAEYRRFRDAEVTRHGGSTDPVLAAILVKASLLLPADDPSLLQRLQPLAEVLEQTLAKDDQARGVDINQSAYNALSMGLMDYRRGKYAETLKWNRRCLTCPDDGLHDKRSAAAHALSAMAAQRLARTELAHAELADAKEIFKRSFTANILPSEQGPGFWPDWAIARILLEEAGALVEGSAPK